MKKKTVSRNPIIVITGKQKHPIRHKMWKFFSQTHIKRLVITASIVAFVFTGSMLVYANRIAITGSIYAMFGLDLEKLKADLEGGGTQAEDPDANVNTDVDSPQQPADSEPLATETSEEEGIADYVIEPETGADEMQPTAIVSDSEITQTSEAAMLNPDDNNEEDMYGGYDV